MKKLNKVAMMFAVAALATAAGAQTRVTAADGGPHRQLAKRHRRTGLEERHQRTVLARCQLDARNRCRRLRRRPGSRCCRPAPAPLPPPLRPPAPAPAPPPAATKVTFAADAFFDFDKSVLKPEGRPSWTTWSARSRTSTWKSSSPSVTPTPIGTDAYNQKLSVRRAEAVKAYLVSKGIEKNRVYTEGKGEKQPVADNKTAEGRAKNRRVEIEVVGTRANK